MTNALSRGMRAGADEVGWETQTGRGKDGWGGDGCGVQGWVGWTRTDAVNKGRCGTMMGGGEDGRLGAQTGGGKNGWLQERAATMAAAAIAAASLAAPHIAAAASIRQRRPNSVVL